LGKNRPDGKYMMQIKFDLLNSPILKVFNIYIKNKFIKSEVNIADLRAVLSLIHPCFISHRDTKAFMIRFYTRHISDPIYVDSRYQKLIFQKLPIITSKFCVNTHSIIFLLLGIIIFTNRKRMNSRIFN
jgi:hypothetical protein